MGAGIRHPAPRRSSAVPNPPVLAGFLRSARAVRPGVMNAHPSRSTAISRNDDPMGQSATPPRRPTTVLVADDDDDLRALNDEEKLGDSDHDGLNLPP